MKTLNIEIDRIPNFNSGVVIDWTDIVIYRLLVEPLFIETKERNVTPNLCQSIYRKNDLQWVIKIHDTFNEKRVELESREFCLHLMKIRESTGVALIISLLFKTIEIVSAKEILLTTTFPIAHLNRVLSNPALIPKNDDHSYGMYKIKNHTSAYLKLAPQYKNLNPLFFSNTENFKLNGMTPDVTGPMTLSPESYKSLSLSNKNHSNSIDLEIYYVLSLPEFISCEEEKILRKTLNTNRLYSSSNGLIARSNSFISGWCNNKQHNNQKNHEGIKKLSSRFYQKTINLCYTDFPTNHEISLAIKQELEAKHSLAIQLKEISYDEYLNKNIDFDSSEDFHLLLMTPTWPHPASILAPFYWTNKTTQEFRLAFQECLNEPCINKAINKAQKAEAILMKRKLGMVPVGKAKGHMLSKINTVWCPHSGWINYSHYKNLDN